MRDEPFPSACNESLSLRRRFVYPLWASRSIPPFLRRSVWREKRCVVERYGLLSTDLNVGLFRCVSCSPYRTRPLSLFGFFVIPTHWFWSLLTSIFFLSFSIGPRASFWGRCWWFRVRFSISTGFFVRIIDHFIIQDIAFRICSDKEDSLTTARQNSFFPERSRFYLFTWHLTARK